MDDDLTSLLGGQSRNAIRGDRWDEKAYSDIYKDAEELKKTVKEQSKKLQTVEKLAEDVFRGLFKSTPQLHEPHEVATSHSFNRELAERMMGLAEYDQLRGHTRLDELSSAIGTKAIVAKLVESIKPEDLEKLNDAQKDVEKKQKRLEELLDEMLELKNQAGQKMPAPQKAANQAQQQKCQQQIANIGGKLQSAVAACQKVTQGVAPNMRAAIRGALQAAQGELVELDDFIGGWGSEKGQPSKLPLGEKLALAKKLQGEKMRQISKMIGRMRRLALHKFKTKIRQIPSEVVDIEIGKDLGRVLPSELVLMDDPDVELEFARKFQSGQLLQYKLEGKESLAKGPIVMMVDNSGSMSGTPEIWSKAVAAGLLEIALKERRRCVVIHYGQGEESLVPFEFDPKDDQMTRVRKLVEMCEYFEGGGTDWESPLKKALEYIDQPQWKKGDLVMVSDGFCAISDAFKEAYHKVKAAKGFRCFSIAIGAPAESFDAFSDTTIPVYDLVRDGTDTAGKLFEML